MEESGNGKLDHIHEVESEQRDEAVVRDVDELKSPAEYVREILVEESPESVNGTRDGGDGGGGSSSSEDEAEVEEKEKHIVDDSVVDPVVLLSEDVSEVVEDPIESLGATAAVDEIKSKEIKEKNLPSADETDGVSPLTNEVKEESTLPFSNETEEVISVVTDVEETPLPSLKDGIPPPAVAEELPESDKKIGNSIVDEESKESVVRSLQTSTDIPPLPPVENIDSAHQEEKHEILQSTENSPIISVSKRTMQPTSWKSCCGIFDVLRRTDR